MVAEGRNPFERFANAFISIIDGPVTWFRESIVKPNQKEYQWYHRQFRRVPNIDECNEGDSVCFFEANEQFKRDRSVDTEIINILRNRFEECIHYESPEVSKCSLLWDQYIEASTNWFIKYGDLGVYGNVLNAYMKQKHRLVWESRHGPVGSGIKE